MKRVGILKVHGDDSGAFSAAIEGNLNAVQWVFGLELAKKALMEQATKGADLSRLVARRVDKLVEEEPEK